MTVTCTTKLLKIQNLCMHTLHIQHAHILRTTLTHTLTRTLLHAHLTHAHTYGHNTHTHGHTHMHTWTYTHMDTHIRTYTHTQTRTHAHTHGHTRIHTLQQGLTALHFAAWKGHVEVVEMLIKEGASPFVQSQSGKTPLQLAQEDEHQQCVLVLQAATSKVREVEKGASTWYCGHYQ